MEMENSKDHPKVVKTKTQSNDVTYGISLQRDFGFESKKMRHSYPNNESVRKQKTHVWNK